MLIEKSSGAVSKIVPVSNHKVHTTFQLVATEAVMANMTDIVFEIPDSDFDYHNMDSYSGGWVPLKYKGETIALNSGTRSVTLYGSIMVRVNKSVDEQVGVAWATV